jgi:non-specific serine/threonine protein kinase
LSEELLLPDVVQRSAEDRHRTLATALDWSYAVLTDRERSVLNCLSVFRGGWDLAAAEAACASGPGEEPVVDIIQSLVDKSLVMRHAEGEGRPGRFRMLTIVRAYARQRLAESGLEHAARDAHLEHFANLAQEAEPHLPTSDRSAWLDRLQSERDNLRAALTWGVDAEGSVAQAARLAVSLSRYWIMRHQLEEARHWLDRLADSESDAITDRLRARLLYHAGSVAATQGDADAAVPRLEAALEAFRRLGDTEGEAWALNDLGMVAIQKNQVDRAEQFYADSLALKRELGHDWDVARSLCNLGDIAWRQGNYDLAEERYRESLAVGESQGQAPDRFLSGVVLSNLGEIAYCRGDYRLSERLQREGLADALEAGYEPLIPLALAGLGGALTAEGPSSEGVRLLAAAKAARERIGLELDPMNLEHFERMVSAARDQMPGPDWESEWAKGSALSVDEACALAFGATLMSTSA